MELSNAPGAVTLALHTNDFDAAMRFYSDILGFVVDIDEWIGEGVIERPFRRLRLLLTEDGPLALEFLADGPAPAVGSPPVLSFVVADFPQVLERFRSWAGQAIIDRETLPYGECLTIRDPSGNRLQVFST